MGRMQKKRLITGLMILALFVLFTPKVALAETCNTGNILPQCVCSGNCNADDFVLMFVNLAHFFLGIVAVFAMYYLVIGGFTLIIATGNPEKIQAGKNTLVNALTGLFVVFAAWVMINTLFFALTGGSDTIFGQKWFQFKTAEPLPTQVVEELDCTDLSSVAGKYQAPYPATEALALTALRNCIESNVPADMIDQNQIYTIDRDHESCNYTRGNPVCESDCYHQVNSCHYGGASGSEGAMGVDYNANQASYTEEQLYDVILDAKNGPCDGLAGNIVFEGDHTHLNAIGCPN